MKFHFANEQGVADGFGVLGQWRWEGGVYAVLNRNGWNDGTPAGPPMGVGRAMSMATGALLPVSPGHERTVPPPWLGAASCAESYLAADIGGTHARLALMTHTPGQGPRLAAYRVYACADHPHLEDIVRDFCQQLPAQPRALVLACAGYLHAGAVINKNLAWPVLLQQLKQRLALEQIWFLNDLEALAYAVGHGAAHDASVLKAPMARAEHAGPVVVLGPGTGLGAAVWLPGPPGRVMATEAGHTQLSARAGIEQRVLAQLAPPDSHVSHEMVLSGPGLHRIYDALCAIHDRYPALHEPSAITAAAMVGGDELARQALDLFCGWLGSFAADLAMLYGAGGGICLAGGFLHRMVDFMRNSSMVERFLDKGVMRPFLQNVPIRVIDQAQLGVLGAAAWHVDTHLQKGAGAAGTYPALT
jgi:glucokinase